VTGLAILPAMEVLSTQADGEELAYQEVMREGSAFARPQQLQILEAQQCYSIHINHACAAGVLDFSR
jgi:hypothetical protein